MHDEFSKEEWKQIIFEIYSAGFEAGCSSQKVDIASAYNQYWDNLLKELCL